MSALEKSDFMVAIRGYKVIKTRTNANCTDVTASDASDKKVLLRSLETQGNESIDLNDVKAMVQVIKREAYDIAILIGKRFNDSAVQEMVKEKIQRVSDEYMPPFNVENLYRAIFTCVDAQCIVKCGKVPLTKSDCQVKKGSDSCEVRSLSDNACFHFEHGWSGLLKNDLKLALALNKHRPS